MLAHLFKKRQVLSDIHQSWWQLSAIQFGWVLQVYQL